MLIFFSSIFIQLLGADKDSSIQMKYQLEVEGWQSF